MQRHSRLLLIIATLALIMGAVCITPCSLSAHITVLLYHKFDEQDSPSTSTSSQLFEQQMGYLKDNGYAVLSLEQLLGCMEGRIPFPHKAVVITLDDGNLSQYTKAFPILKRHGYPFSVFIFTRAPGVPGYMDWEQIRELKRFGAEVGSHTHTHPYLTDLAPRKIEQELSRSKKILEDNLETEIRWFAYPFGYYDETSRSLVRQSGCRLAFTSDPGSVGAHTTPHVIPRQAIVGDNLDMAGFIEKLNRPPLNVLRRSPQSGRLPGSSISEISLTIARPELYLPDQIQVFLSEKGRIPASFDPATGILRSTESITITRKMNRVILTARRKSDRSFAMDSYMILLPEEGLPESTK
ncbi:MAG: polysaccharide deacetylase family protein [Desulfomonilia bacterium]|nr:polysaccharide deacetylase family protein [Desulfomonilia bacterium]